MLDDPTHKNFDLDRRVTISWLSVAVSRDFSFIKALIADGLLRLEEDGKIDLKAADQAFRTKYGRSLEEYSNREKLRNTDTHMSGSSFAKEVGKTRWVIEALIRRGVITRENSGLIDVEKAKAAIQAEKHDSIMNVTPVAFAKLIGKENHYVYGLIKKGVVERDEQGLINVEKAKEAQRKYEEDPNAHVVKRKKINTSTHMNPTTFARETHHCTKLIKRLVDQGILVLEENGVLHVESARQALDAYLNRTATVDKSRVKPVKKNRAEEKARAKPVKGNRAEEPEEYEEEWPIPEPRRQIRFRPLPEPVPVLTTAEKRAAKLVALLDRLFPQDEQEGQQHG